MEERATLELIAAPDRTDAPLVVLVDSDEHPLPWPPARAGAGYARLVVDDWNRDLSPWPAPPLVRSQPPFGGRASETLLLLTEDLLPALERAEGIRPSSRAIMGYSLGGLFSLYALMECEAFVAAACCSGSLWFDGWLDYLRARPSLGRPAYCYLSLGRKERRARNPRLKTVEDALHASAAALEERGAVCELDLFDGGHGHQVQERLAAGLAALGAHLVLP